MKMIKLLFFLLMSCMISGCQNRTDYDVTFKEMVIDLNSEQHPISLVESVDGKAIDESWIRSNKITYHNFVIEANDIDTSIIGWYDVVYKTNDIKNKEIKKRVQVKDISKPLITLKEENIEVYEDDVDDLDYYSLFSIDDNSGKDNLIIRMSSNVENTAGEYQVYISVSDEAKNINEATINIKVKKKIVQNDNQNTSQNKPIEENKNNSSHTQSTNESSSTTKPSQSNSSSQSTSKPSNSTSASHYDKYFEGRSIENYNNACDYAEEILSSGKAKGYEVMPTGEGYQVKFS